MSHAVADPVFPSRSPAAPGPFARLAEAWMAGQEAAHRYLLLLRFLLVNLAGVAFVAVAWMEGWIAFLLAADRTRLVSAIALLFLIGLVWCGQRVLVVSRELNGLESGAIDPAGRVGAYLRDIAGRDAGTRGNLAAILRIKLFARIAPVRHVANSLVLLGLVGTVLGFIIALSGVNPELVSDVSAVGPMISTLIEGMSVALHTTLVGALLNVWLMVAYRILEGGTVRLFTKAVELGERHVRP